MVSARWLFLCWVVVSCSPVSETSRAGQTVADARSALSQDSGDPPREDSGPSDSGIVTDDASQLADASRSPDAPYVCRPGTCAGCCSAGVCLPGNVTLLCGAGGGPCSSCQTACVNGGCSGCEPTAIDTQPCGNCGKMSRTCGSDGTWGNFSACMDQGVCKSGDLRGLVCGNCGTQVDTCSDTCQWVGGACGMQGQCAPQSTRDVACGNCGTRTDTCDTTCQWSTGTCASQGECTPGDHVWKPCGACGHFRNDCDTSCQWVRGTTCQSQCGAQCPDTCYCANLPDGYCTSPCCP